MIHPRFVPYVSRHITRHRARTLLTVLGVAIAMFLFTTVQAMHQGVATATRATATDTTLVVYRQDRFCPATSVLPQDYASRIKSIDGVKAVIPMKIVVNNCRTSLDVVTFRGVPKEEFFDKQGDQWTITQGSIEDWMRRTDASLIGETLATRRGLRPGQTFDAAGITTYVAGIIRSESPQDQNVAYAAIDFVQQASRSGLGLVTQFNVTVADHELLEPIAVQIDEMFKTAQEPTDTWTEKAFVGRVADDVIELVGFARYLAIGCLAAILALIANAIVLNVQSRISEHAVLQTLGFSSSLIARLILLEGAILAGIGGMLGAAASYAVIEYSAFALSNEGQSIPIAADPKLIVIGLVLCAGIGVLAGLVPAIQASRREIAACFRTV